jgi:hypothetical protein
MALPRRLSHWIVLAAAGGAAFYGAHRFAAPDPAEQIAQPVVRPAAAAHAAGPAPAPVALVLPPQRAAIEVGRAADAFASVSWIPAPPPLPVAPPAVRPPPPPAPAAPPPPFKYIGLLEQKTDRPTAFLAKGEALHIVRAGDVLDGAYRIESLSPAQVVITHLPSNERQTLGVTGGHP